MPRPSRPVFLVCIGADDPFIPPEERANFEAEMRVAGSTGRCTSTAARAQLHQPGGRQARKPEAIRFSAEADTRSWAAMCAFFEEIFGV